MVKFIFKSYKYLLLWSFVNIFNILFVAYLYEVFIPTQVEFYLCKYYSFERNINEYPIQWTLVD